MFGRFRGRADGRTGPAAPWRPGPSAGSLFEAVAALRSWWWLFARKSLDAHLELRAALGEDDPIVTADGGLMTLFELRGCRSAGREEQLAFLADRLAARLAEPFRGPGHALHIVFDRDPEAGPGIAAATLRGPRAAAARLGLDLADLLDDREGDLARRVVREHCYVALWSRDGLLPREEARDAGRRVRRARAAAERVAGRGGPGQDPDARLAGIAARHEAVARDLADAADGAGLSLRRLGARETLGVARTFLAGHVSAADTPAGGIAAREEGLVEEDPERSGGGAGPEAGPGAMPGQAPRGAFRIRVADTPAAMVRRPALAPALISREPSVEGGLARIGERWFAGLHVMLGPSAPRPFDELLAGLARSGVPFRQSILIEGNAGGAYWKGAAAAILAVAGHGNRVIRDRIEGLRAAAAEGEALARVSMVYLTWAGDAEEARRRRDILRQRIGAWGGQSVSDLLGDPLETWAASLPGFAAVATAPRAIAPLRDAFALAPLQRPADAEEGAGGQALVGDAGKPLSQPVLADGQHSFHIVFGEPGKGKSVLLNARALATALAGGQAELPLMGILDIGPSAAGLVSLLRAALPPERRDEAIHLRLTGDRRHAINPFDTPVGCRRPPAHQEAFLRNLAAATIRPAGEDALPGGLDTLVPEIVAEAYRMRDDGPPDSQPNLYAPGQLAEVDDVLAEQVFLMGTDPTWWWVVDRMVALGRYDLAASAQRYAVPVLADLAAAANTDRIRDSHGRVRLSSGETPGEAVTRILGAALRDYPALAGRTALNLGAARVAVLDLSEVADPGDGRRTAIFYLAARQALAGDWFLTEEDVASMPQSVRGWHGERVRRLLETEKLLQYDEFHRCGGVPEVVAQVGLDVREGRKHRRRVVLASQRAEDFDRMLRDLASAVWILGADAVATQNRLIEDFDLDGGAAHIVRRELTGPGPEGAPALLVTQDARGRGQRHVRTVAGPVELWALTTTPHDAALRDRLYRRLDPAEARAALAARFPAGTVGRDLLARRAGAGAVDETRLLDDLADEIAAAANAARDEDVRQAVRRVRSARAESGASARPSGEGAETGSEVSVAADAAPPGARRAA